MRYYIPLLISILSLFLQVSPARSQAPTADHLVPLPGALTLGANEYAQAATLRQELGLDSVRAPLVLVVVQPSFTPAYALWVERASATSYWLEYRSTVHGLAQQHVSQAVRIRRRFPLEPAVAQSLIDVVAVALAQTRYDNFQGMRGDGTTYTFINSEAGVGLHGGSTWSPRSPAMSQLVEIVEYLHPVPTGIPTGAFSQASLLAQARGLLRLLASR